MSKYDEEPVPLANADAKHYKGQWVAIVNNKIVAHDESIEPVIKKARKLDKNPEFVRVSKGNIAMY